MTATEGTTDQDESSWRLCAALRVAHHADENRVEEKAARSENTRSREIRTRRRRRRGGGRCLASGRRGIYDVDLHRRGGVPRFTQPDTIVPSVGNGQDLNRYTYVRNNPVNYNDPSGHCVGGLWCPDPIEDTIDDIEDFVDDLSDDVADLVTDTSELMQDFTAEAGDRFSEVDRYFSQLSSVASPAAHPLDRALQGVEALVGTGQILLFDAQVYSGDMCATEAACLTGGLPLGDAGATTFGSTVVFRGDNPRDSFIAHEIQHVYDIGFWGPTAFYGSYLLESAYRSITGHGDSYEDLIWERRANNVQDNFPTVQPAPPSFSINWQAAGAFRLGIQ